MKYIRAVDSNGFHEIFVFPKTVNHDDMAEALSGIKNTAFGGWERIAREPVSAGFVSESGECFGSSVSLGIKSDPTDTDLLLKQYEI